MSKKLTAEEFIERAILKHGDIYDYSETRYISSNNKLTITCPEHGNFEVRANAHLSGYDCQKCRKTRNQTLKFKGFIQKSILKHNNFYNYDKVYYVKADIKVTITCPVHGDFKQSPRVHYNGSGCSYCATEKTLEEKYQNKETKLYYIHLPQYDLYKIGLTQYSVQSRFIKDIKNGIEIETVSTKTFQDGIDALEMEQLVLSKYKAYQYQGEKILGAGNTELFTENILKEYLT